MIMTASHIAKAYGTDIILKDVTLGVKERQCVALVGPNGAGKSTVLKIIAKELSSDSGEVHLAKDTTIGYLAQHSSVDSEKTVYEEVSSVYSHLREIETQLREVELEMSKSEVYSDESIFAAKSKEYERLSQLFTSQNGYAIDANIRGVLHGLDFPKATYDQSVASLSGGQKTRLALAKQLLIQPDLLILDEPTNYLDIERLEWLEQYLKGYPCSLLIVSHDRSFLDALAQEVYEIERGVSKRYKGNYTAYLQQKAQDLERQTKQYEQQQTEIARTEEYIRRNIEGVNTKMAQGRRKMLEKMDRLEKPLTNNRQVRFAFKTDKLSGYDVLSVGDVSIGYKEKVLSKNIELCVQRGECVALVGANGIGKSTLLKSILGEMKLLEGEIKLGSNLKIGYYMQEQENLDMKKTILQEVWDAYPRLDRQEIRTILSQFLFTDDDLEKVISSLSGGERARVALVKLMLQNANFLILDEPTNHLDLLSKEVLEGALADYEGTMLFISHDRFFLNRLATRVVELSEDGLTSYLGNYDDYIEKKGQLIELAKESQPDIAQSEKRNSFEEMKSQQRAERAAQREEKRKQERIIEIESEIDQLEELILKLETELCDPNIFDDPVKYKEVNDNYSNSTEKLESLLAEWEVFNL